MDLGRIREAEYRLSHRHSDGSWGELREVPPRDHHDPSSHDPERSWPRRRLFACTSCDELVAISPESEETGPR